MNELPPEPPEPLAQELLIYWLRDLKQLGTVELRTVESIVEWWLLEHRIQQTTGEVQTILKKLVALGWVLQRPQADGRIFYQLNRDKERDARAWLGSSCGTDSGPGGKHDE